MKKLTVELQKKEYQQSISNMVKHFSNEKSNIKKMFPNLDESWYNLMGIIIPVGLLERYNIDFSNGKTIDIQEVKNINGLNLNRLTLENWKNLCKFVIMTLGEFDDDTDYFEDGNMVTDFVYNEISDEIFNGDK